MKRLAQIGTFNVDNLGDLLFPVVFAQIVQELNDSLDEKYQLDFFSPHCENYVPTYSDQQPVKDIKQFNNQTYNKVFIGGGDLLRSDDWSINEIYNTTQLSFTSIISPTNRLINNCYTIGLGVPFELDEGFAKYVKNSFNRFEKISVRDIRSQAFLAQQNIPSEIVPDLVLSISRYFPKEDLARISKKVFERNNIWLHDQSYLIFQANDSVLQAEEIVEISELLNALSVKLQAPVILLSIGECLGDNKLYEELIPLLDNCHVIDKNGDPSLTLLEKVAVLATAQGFIGSSLHGNIISYSYNIPHITFTGDYSTKLKGFFKLVDREKYCFHNPKDVLNKQDIIAEYLIRDMNNDEELQKQISVIIEFVRQAIVEDLPNSTQLYSSELDCLFKMEQLIINEKNKEISNLWTRVNGTESKYKDIVELNTQLWKRVDDSERYNSEVKTQNEDLWQRVNETESLLNKERKQINDLWNRVTVSENINNELSGELDNNRNLIEKLQLENERLSQIEGQYKAALNSFKYYLKKKFNKRGK